MMIGSAFGKDIQGLGSALAGGIQEQQQNQVANQLLAQYYPDQAGTTDPNADLSTDLPEDVSPDIGGTGTSDVQGNFQGGAAELKMRQDAAKQALGIQNVQDEIAQRQAARALASKKAAGVGLGAGSASRWLAGGGDGQGGYGGQGGQRGRGGKQPAYVAGSGDVQNDESTDNFDQIRADFDNQYGKGAFDKFQAEGGGSEVLDKDGNLTGYSVGGVTSTDANGNPVVKKPPIATVPVQDASMWMQRVNAARNKAGQQPVEKMIGKDSVYGQPQNPGSTAKAGTAQNPIVAQSALHVRSLPFGTYVYDPNTKQTYQKQKPAGQ
jgi:hypothetical protein